MKTAAPGAFARTPLDILMLEDNRFDAELVSELLRSHYTAARVTCVPGGEAYLQALRSSAFDLVLSDYEVPGYGGPEALDAARAQAPRAPFIFVSGVIGEENAVEMLKRGATDYVSKNRLARLPMAIDRALREVAAREARERAERQLREVDRIYTRVVDALKDYAVILLDPAGTVRDWNRGADIVFGISREDAIGTPVSRLYVADDRAAGVPEAELAGARRDGTHAEDRWLQRADGSRLRAEGVLTALLDDAGTLSGYCKIVRDATVAFESSVALRDAKEEAERANRAKDRFLAVLSHELRTPLAPIASAARLLEERLAVPESLASLLPMIRRNVALEARLIEDLLDLTAISAGKVSLRLAPVDMRAIVDGVSDMVADGVADKRLRYTVEWGATHDWVRGDAARLQQVLWNVVRNALKFTSPGGLIRLLTDDHEGRFRLRCIDDGIGIDPAAQARIFTAFEQADRDVSKRFGGLGLGLAIARGLVLEHGGELVVHSEGVGRGATFALSLPVLAASDVPSDGAGRGVAGATAAAAPRDGNVRMLLVEDNEDAAMAMAMSFEYLGYRVTHVATLSRALAAAREHEFDVVVSDLGLPDGSGIALGPALAERMPLIALSGFGSDDDVRRSKAAGFVYHLVKPADPDELHAAITQALARRAAVERA